MHSSPGDSNVKQPTLLLNRLAVGAVRQSVRDGQRPVGQAGRRISVMISSGSSAVVSAPRKKSFAAMKRAPAFPVTAISASQVTTMPGISAAGSASLCELARATR